MATGGAASSSGTFCVSQSSFSCQIWLPGQATNRSLPSNLLPSQSLQAKVGVMKCPTACFCDGLKHFLCQTVVTLFAPGPGSTYTIPFFTTMIWQAQRRASPAPAAGAAEAAAVKELRALMVGGQKCQHNPKGQGPKPKEVARQHKRSLCQPHSTSGMAKKMKMKTLPGCRL